MLDEKDLVSLVEGCAVRREGVELKLKEGADLAAVLSSIENAMLNRRGRRAEG